MYKLSNQVIWQHDIYATFRLLDDEVGIPLPAINMGTSVRMIERHYSHLLSKLASDRLTRMSKQMV